jgi:hypothetical protein
LVLISLSVCRICHGYLTATGRRLLRNSLITR